MPEPAPFFRPGGTMDPSAASYIERSADQELLDALMAREYVFLLDSRQKGKSSMVARTMVRLKEAGVTPIKLDLQRIGANVSPDQWYAGLLGAIADEVGLTDEAFEYWGGHQHVGPLARWVGAITDVILAKTSVPMVVFIDEVDFVRALPFPTDEFFAAIRDCYNRRAEERGFDRLTFCLVGVATPGHLIRNPEITPFNVGRRIDITDFSQHDLLPYVEPIGGEGRDGETLLDRVFHWLNGHPYLTQLVCRQIVGDPTIRSAADVDALIDRLLLTADARHREANLADVERRLLEPDLIGLPAEEALTQVLTTYRRVLKGSRVDFDEKNPVLSSLILSGVAAILEDRLVVRNRAYQTIFDEGWRREAMPEAEKRRQSRAARRAGFRVGIVGLIVLGASIVVGDSFRRLAKSAEAERDRARYEAYAAAMTACTQFRQDQYFPGIQAAVDLHRENPSKGWEWQYWNNVVSDRALAEDDGTVIDWRWSRDGKSILGRSPLGINWFDPDTGRIIHRMSAPTTVRASARELPDGTVLDIRWDGSTRLYDPKSARELWRINGLPFFWRNTSCLSSNGRFLAGHDNGPLWVLDTETKTVTRPIPPPSCSYYRPSFGSGDELMAVAVGRDAPDAVHDIALISTRTWEIQRRIPLNVQISSIAVSPIGSELFVGLNDGALLAFSVASGKRIFEARISDRPIWRMEFSSDGNLVAAGLLNDVVAVFQKSSGVWSHFADVEAAVDGNFSPDSKRILASFQRARVLNVSELQRTAFEFPGKALWLRADNEALVAFERGGSGRVFTIRGGKLVPKHELEGPVSNLTDGVSPYYCVKRHDRIDVMSIEGGDPLCSIPPFPTYVAALKGAGSQLYIVRYRDSRILRIDLETQTQQEIEIGFVPSGGFGTQDGKRLIIGGANGEMALLDGASGQFRTLRFRFHSVHGGSFSSDGSSFVAAFSDGTLRLIDWESSQVKVQFDLHPGMAICAVISPDGKRVVSGGGDKAVRVWDATNGRLLTVLRGHKSEVRQVEFIRDGATIVSVDSSAECRLWQTSRDDYSSREGGEVRNRDSK